MSILGIVLIVAAAAACCALCGYGIATAVRRSKARREQAVRTPTLR